ncbi:putative nuclease HARBI1 [Cinnamomum micranthum f. kanehirae]|uniref:Putative nuclease HARBI1 n=1 Tax=Cinnamomum micranthum f. kanehirae TaxID=337451 RepID=A0A3S3MWJ2_9MAGN|nr:putative nuclease HARBI1 [Cinnamomum micranthum f. kanehirae]
MTRRPFVKLCHLLSTIGKLEPTRHMLFDEQVAISLHILAHHVKNRVIQNEFNCSAESISRHFKMFFIAVIRLQGELYKKPKPIPENSVDEKWKWFKGCLGALDGTNILVHVLAIDRPRYRTRKNHIAANVLAACTPDLHFTYVLPGWEGSAADGRVLRDAIARRHGLVVPRGPVIGLPEEEHKEAVGEPQRLVEWHADDVV